MKIAIRHPKDFYAGLLFAGFGAFAVIVARNYPMGSLFRMGAGYFPTLLGAVLVVLGLALMVRALIVRGPKRATFAWKPALFVLGAVVAFGLLLRPLGLIVASMVLVVGASLVHRPFRVKEIAILALALTLLSWLLFVLGLGLPFPVLPRWG